jgi:hypothetical protein
MHPLGAFLLCLAVIAITGRRLAAAGRALGIPPQVVTLLESIALG